MTTREMIQSELEHVPEERLDDLYGIVKQFSHASDRPMGIMAKLQAIPKIDAPADFSTNFDIYMSGEKRVEDNLH
jgi:hypothetical protein